MNNQTKHTPGPWSLLPARKLVNVKGPRGEQICQLPISDPNAHLIAAAPEMLEELRADLEMLIELRDKHLRHTAAIVRALVQKRIEATDAAIAKAEGSANASR